MTNEEEIASDGTEELEVEHQEDLVEEEESAEETSEAIEETPVQAHDPDHEPGDVNGNTWDAPDPYLQAYVATMDSITEASRGGVVDLGGGRRGRGKGGNVNGNRAQPKKKRSSSRSTKGILPPDDPYWQFGMPVEYWGLSVGKAGQYAEGGGQQGNTKPRGGNNSNSRRGRSGNGGQQADDPNGARKKRRRRRRRGGRRGGTSEGGERSGRDNNKSPGNDS